MQTVFFPRLNSIRRVFDTTTKKPVFSLKTNTVRTTSTTVFFFFNPETCLCRCSGSQCSESKNVRERAGKRRNIHDDLIRRTVRVFTLHNQKNLNVQSNSFHTRARTTTFIWKNNRFFKESFSIILGFTKFLCVFRPFRCGPSMKYIDFTFTNDDRYKPNFKRCYSFV